MKPLPYLALLSLVPAAFPVVSGAATVTVSGHYIDDARGDAGPERLLTGELGDAAVFPLAGAVDYHTHRTGQPAGTPDDGVYNDWTVHLENLSGQAWTNLYFVADAGVTIGNADGTVKDAAAAPGVFTDAFHIDAVGLNASLFHESIADDGIFAPGEEWEFSVANFNTGVNSLPPQLITPGVFAGSSPAVGFGGTNASLLASPVPEPATLLFLAAGAACALLRRPRRG